MVRLRPLPAALPDDPSAGADDPHAVRASGRAAAIATAATSRLVFMFGGSFVDAPLGIHCGPGGVGAPPRSGGVAAPHGLGALERPQVPLLSAVKAGARQLSNRFDSGLAKSAPEGPGADMIN